MKDNDVVIKTSWFAIVPDILLCFVIIGFFRLPITVLKILTTKLTINNKFVSGKKGILKIEKLDSPINKITSVKVEQSFIGQLFKYGTININTAMGFFTFNCIDNPTQVKDYILSKME